MHDPVLYNMFCVIYIYSFNFCKNPVGWVVLSHFLDDESEV